MGKRMVEDSMESRIKQRRGDSPEYTSPGREVLNSALSLAAVIGITLVGGAVMRRVVERTVAKG